MTRYFLSRIKIEGFRGINNEGEPLELKFRSNAVNSVYAINGLGKSSVYEALNYAIRGNVPKLTELQAQERPDDYYCNKFHSQGTATIEIELEPDDSSANVIIVVNRASNGERTVTSPTGTSDPEAILSRLDEDFTLLDYQTFKRFIDSSPLERGRSFSALLGLSVYSDFRQTLQAASDTRVLKSDLNISAIEAEIRGDEDAAGRAQRRMSASYERLTGKQLSDLSKIEQYENDVLDAISAIPLFNNKLIGKTLDKTDFDALKKSIKDAEGGDDRKELEAIIAAITEAQGIGPGDNELYKKEQQQFMKLLQEKEKLISETQGEPFKKLYATAKDLIDCGDWDHPNKCPLCKSEIQEAIKELISEELEKFDKVKTKDDEIVELWKTITWPRRLNSLEQASLIEKQDEEKISPTLSRRIDTGEMTIEIMKEAVETLCALEKEFQKILSSHETRKEQLEKMLPPSMVRLTEQVENARQFHEALEEYREKTEQKELAQSRLKHNERWKQYINGITEVFSTAEANLSRKKIEDIDQEYKEIFENIMGVKDVVPELQRSDRREDLYVQLSDFHGQSGLSARALLSESFRNALAVSVFLSAAMKQTGAPRFIVLDDVTSSFDSGHQWNLMEIIRRQLQQPNNRDGVQFIILSHDSLLEKYFDKIGNTNDWHHQKLQGMPPMGMVLSQAQDADRLRATADRLLDAGQEQEAKPIVRQYLEFKLLKIIQKVKIPVPLDFAIKDERKMVSNSIDAISSAIDLHKKAGDLIMTQQQEDNFKDVLVPALIANWINHYETDASTSIAPAVLRGVLSDIDNVSECFRYDDTTGGSGQRKWYISLSSRN